ncbi:hypothetical protein SETIT_2G388900v2 [Setaria italica]|uniref:Serpin domain-containing protein n=1 Tax=Setaria italica TaxID=4555 RepID=A0A368Q7I7_SETIT|nr:hypothetical protein SETIT_2G388900v2 [Setaria italica]
MWPSPPTKTSTRSRTTMMTTRRLRHRLRSGAPWASGWTPPPLSSSTLLRPWPPPACAGQSRLAEINKWLESKTGGHVQGLLPGSSISASTLLILANAIYFRGYWYDHFLPDMTRDATFHVSPGHEVTVPFMEGKDLHARMQVIGHPGFKVLRMPYAAGMCQQQQSFSMYIYLPDDRDGLPRLLRIPKFDVSLRADVSRLLEDLGLDLTMFRPAGDSFSEMVALLAGADDEDTLPPMAVPSIVQQCSAHVNERGTVAAAATALEILGFVMDDSPEPVVDFVADHPFLFFIKEDHSRVVVFADQVVDPSDHHVITY